MKKTIDSFPFPMAPGAQSVNNFPNDKFKTQLRFTFYSQFQTRSLNIGSPILVLLETVSETEDNIEQYSLLIVVERKI